MLEVLVAIILLGLATIPLLNFFVSGNAFTARAGNEVAALNFAQELLEEIKSIPDNQIGKVQGSTENTIKLEPRASSVDGYYKDWVVALAGGTGAGQVRRIAAYNGTTRTATVDRNWDNRDVWPDTTTTYVLLKVAADRYPFRISLADAPGAQNLRTVTVTVYYQDRGQWREVSLTTDKLRR